MSMQTELVEILALAREAERRIKALFSAPSNYGASMSATLHGITRAQAEALEAAGGRTVAYSGGILQTTLERSGARIYAFWSDAAVAEWVAHSECPACHRGPQPVAKHDAEQARRAREAAAEDDVL